MSYRYLGTFWLLSNQFNHRCSYIASNPLDNLGPCPTIAQVRCLHPRSSLLPHFVVYWLFSSLTVCRLLSVFTWNTTNCYQTLCYQRGIWIPTLNRLSKPFIAIIFKPTARRPCMSSLGSPIRIPLWYTGCPRRNGQNFGRVFLMLNYTDITQNTYIQSW